MNAKQEFEDHVKGKVVECVKITIGEGIDVPTFILKQNYNQFDYEAFLTQLDFDYYDGFGGQMLYGNIWYDNGTWSERGEYDGAEWWEYKEVPAIPNECN